MTHGPFASKCRLEQLLSLCTMAEIAAGNMDLTKRERDHLAKLASDVKAEVLSQINRRRPTVDRATAQRRRHMMTQSQRASRDAEIVRLHSARDEFWSLSSLGEKFGLSRSGINAILAKNSDKA